MIQRRRSPVPTWDGRKWHTTPIVRYADVDRGPGPVGIMPKHVVTGRALGDMERNRPPDLSQYRRLSQ